MKTRLRDVLMLTVSALAAAGGAHAATVTVTITGLADTSYELEVSGVRKTGRLAATSGAATARDTVDLGQRRGQVKATLTFTGPGGVLATCPPIEVKVDAAQPACDPLFTLSDQQSSGAERFVCKTTCDRSRLEKSRQDEDDDEEWVYALSDTARSFQSFYKRSMGRRAGAVVYSCAANSL